MKYSEKNTIAGIIYYCYILDDKGKEIYPQVFIAIDDTGGMGKTIKIYDKTLKDHHRDRGRLAPGYNHILTMVNEEQEEWFWECINKNEFIPPREGLFEERIISSINNIYEIY